MVLLPLCAAMLFFSFMPLALKKVKPVAAVLVGDTIADLPVAVRVLSDVARPAVAEPRAPAA